MTHLAEELCATIAQARWCAGHIDVDGLDRAQDQLRARLATTAPASLGPEGWAQVARALEGHRDTLRLVGGALRGALEAVVTEGGAGYPRRPGAACFALRGPPLLRRVG